ncbi:MAG: high-affinity zinc transporter periplasmic component [Candidatus Methanofastidiosum methylothiophilum]|jgi:zinc transport system substrate-binding protein|uniref:High-affinity zinc transporter periplasmic component n=1 Tax=Candidatus Methanofastidiosum methylothiophilum TaxID=1705564 RepID=A0A150JLV1_9EURY|nr:MAG: high-affinity zinc transporter periplasmic component [Candidatus Methanofastidiosum methylthiophilus]KYC56752.1 MAG: high-affinity zinc transporter periplasmic component [Candidatus Methanofastidiosum methylthiophilus]KYC57844.1 MAG: high-affinity zinc transporter periplasmic component [Candidatus Methanofastidiosum methylthiophilus]MBP6932145.1 zinc ABC transporter substrate-binding protein [Methanofastidiosum sp.]OQC52354.1 MAG: high-affinity zinc transporter periplasmic component [Eu
MIEAIGGEKVSVWILVPQGSDPHNADLKPSQLKELSKADVYVMIGSGIEFEVKSMAKIRDLNKKMLIIDSSKGIELIEAKSQRHIDGNETEIKGGKDPHIWTSLRNGKIMVQNIYEGLVMADPENKDYYLKNRDIYTHRLDEADTLITKELRIIENRSFMVFHPSWGYFARDYNLTQIAIEIEGKEPTLQSIVSIIKEAERNNLKTIFISPGFSSKAAEIISKEIDGKIEVIDPLAENYIENLKITAIKIKEK